MGYDHTPIPLVAHTSVRRPQHRLRPPCLRRGAQLCLSAHTNLRVSEVADRRTLDGLSFDHARGEFLRFLRPKNRTQMWALAAPHRAPHRFLPLWPVGCFYN